MTNLPTSPPDRLGLTRAHLERERTRAPEETMAAVLRAVQGIHGAPDRRHSLGPLIQVHRFGEGAYVLWVS